MNDENQEITKQEIKKEFQLERMILFSDAVFAIVITLMAIEIHLPETNEQYTEATFLLALKHIFPTIFAYAISFFFIGLMWYKHLTMFSLLKDYNKGLIIRNLIFLFFVGLFPFGASLIVSKQTIFLPPLIYFFIIILCMGAQLLLHDYILNRAKDLIVKVDLAAQRADLKRRIRSLISMVIFAVLGYITYLLINDKDDKQYAIFWVFGFIIIAYRINRSPKDKTLSAKTKDLIKAKFWKN